MERGLWGFVSGTIVKPEVKTESTTVSAAEVLKSKEKLEDYELRSDKAYSLLALSVEKHLQIHVSSKSNAKEAWESLKKHFEFVSVAQMVRLTRRFYAAEMGEGGDLMTHITDMTSLAEQLREMKEDISSKKFAIVILGSLPESYDNFLTSMNARDVEKLDWEDIKGALTEEYMKRKDKDENKPNKPDEALFTVRRGGSSMRGGRGGGRSRGGGHPRSHPYSRENSNVGRQGDTAPPQFTSRPFRGNCFRCNEVGHRANVCPTLGNNERDEASMAVAHDDWFHEDDMALLVTTDEGEINEIAYEPKKDGDETSEEINEYEEIEINEYEEIEIENAEDDDDSPLLSVNESAYFNETTHFESAIVDCISTTAVAEDERHNDDHNDEMALVSSVESGNDSPDDEVKREWCVDSGASQHMTYDKDTLSNMELFDEPKPVYLGDKSVVLSHGQGQTRLQTGSNGSCLTLRTVLYVPKLAKNLLSVRSMTKHGAEVRFVGDKCIASKNGQSVIIGFSENGSLYKLLSPVMPWIEKAYISSLSSSPSLLLWHQRYGHLNMKDVVQNSKNNVVGMEINGDDDEVHRASECEACALGKMHKLPFPKQSQHRSTKLLEIIHSDLCGPMQVESVGGSRYVLTFTDDCSRYSVVYFLKKKSEVLSKFQEFVNYVENTSGHACVRTLNIVNKIRSDNGGEYTSKSFIKYCTDKGITRQFTNPYCPEQNGVSERLNRTIIEGARSMLCHAKLPLKFWAEAVSTTVYLRNRSPTSALNGKTPFEHWFGEKPDVSNLRVFGCLCYVHIPDNLRRKLDPKSYKAVFVGYPDGTKGYKVMNIDNGRFSRTRDVTFHERQFHDFKVEDKSDSSMLFPLEMTVVDEARTDVSVKPVVKPVEVVNTQPPAINSVGAIEPSLQSLEIHDEIVDPHVVDHTNRVGESDGNVSGKSKQAAVKPTYEQTFMDQVANIGNRRERKPPNRLIADDADTCCLASLTSDLEEPKNFKQAVDSEHSEHWGLAMKDEYDSLLTNNTWELVPRPSDQNVIGCRWVYKVKRRGDGSIDRYKARLVARGYSQTEGVDYEEVFAPVARATTIRTLLSLANSYNLEVHQMDVKTAFLHGVLDCDLYMEQPEGYVDPEKPDFVCKLNKGLYGLKQAARCWNETLDKYLVDSGYTKCSADSCLYIKFDGESFVIMAVYVDDIIPVSNDIELLQAEKRAICQQFEMVDNGEIEYFLGMFIKRDRESRTLSISQPNYVESVLAKFGMSDCKPVATPVEAGVRYEKRSDDEESCDVRKYQRAIGCLTYLSTATRPDISAAVGMLSKFMADPGVNHWVGVKRVLRYLRGTHNYGLVFVGDNDDALIGYSDSDWAGDVVTRRSTSGYVFQFGNSTVSWSSRRQATVAKSSTEAEYVALSMATQEAVWLRRLLSDVGLQVDTATTIYEDNQGAIDLSKNPKHHNRTKHIDVSFHFTRERMAAKEIDVSYIPTEHNLADVMTKGLGKVPYEKFREWLGVCGC